MDFFLHLLTNAFRFLSWVDFQISNFNFQLKHQEDVKQIFEIRNFFFNGKFNEFGKYVYEDSNWGRGNLSNILYVYIPKIRTKNT